MSGGNRPTSWADLVIIATVIGVAIGWIAGIISNVRG